MFVLFHLSVLDAMFSFVIIYGGCVIFIHLLPFLASSWVDLDSLLSPAVSVCSGDHDCSSHSLISPIVV
ncbi:hypothetical protein VNO77_37532 [Canavalia gladiata]|uniref:Uncharacterized protein n=1 Tax=Canavalia gladiata TaxID=3824 RepID=A0AAN9KAL7_CANGL